MTLRLILGDQLNHQHSWFQKVDPDVRYVMYEMRQETDYTRHHIQKVVGFFAAMRNFAKELGAIGHHVAYWQLDHPDNKQSLTANLKYSIQHFDVDYFEYMLPDEFRLDQQLKDFCNQLDIPSSAVDSEHFLTSRSELRDFFGQKNFLMEFFYRNIRRRFDILMEGDKPVSGKWNYDASNRKKIPKNQLTPEPLLFDKDISSIHQMIKALGVKTIGHIDPEKFSWPISRDESLALLDYFVEHLLEHFGRFQDAMTTDSWTLYHSRLSFSMNVKLISPLEVVSRAIDAWREMPEKIDLAQIEGFVRQIIGWREYMRGIYWDKMPSFGELNFFSHKNKLPDWYWTGDTKMACLRHAINQSLEYAYAHHIQRLMVTGNFALLAGVDPDELDEWYLGIYIDAIEWVEITNTRGMSQFADGGIVGTKPYCSSAAYINKMSHYCKNCFYDYKQKTGPQACPFNSLYWNFYDRHRDKLGNNPRIGMMYRTWDRMDGEKRADLLEQAKQYLGQINEL